MSLQISKFTEEYRGDSDALKIKLINRSNGVFLWVVMVIRRLLEEQEYGTIPSELEPIVDDLPMEMEDLYENILHRLDRSREELRKVILQWVLLAERPLTIKECLVAVTMNYSLENMPVKRNSAPR